MIVDSHAHIHSQQFDDDRAEVVARARAAGIGAIVTVGCDMEDSQRALEAARTFDCYASVGIHPHEAKDAPADIASAFAPFLADPRVVAVGETGLDFYYDHSPHEDQRDVLRAQLRVAREHGKPVIFHQRDAYDDFVEVLREEFTPGMRGVIHCFTGTAEQARRYVGEFGMLLGIGGVCTFKSAQELRDAIAAVGIAPLILETDCPYLAPVPYRGKRNEPAFITGAAAKVAEILSLDEAAVIAKTTANAEAFFNVSASRASTQRTD